MTYRRSTTDEFRVSGNYGYGHGFEEVTCADNRAEARQLLKDYRANEPGVPFKLTAHRIRIFKTDRRGVVEVFDVAAYRAPYLAASAENPDDSTLHRPDIAQCGACGRSWDDAVITSWTPAPSARCPFEYDHAATEPTTAERLEYLRSQIRAERISYGELAELADLADYIGDDDVELLEWAGVEEGSRRA